MMLSNCQGTLSAVVFRACPAAVMWSQHTDKLQEVRQERQLQIEVKLASKKSHLQI